MAEAWPPSVGARVRPVETAQVAFSPEGEPVSLQGEGPTPLWARLRWPLPSDGDDRREALVSDVEEGVPEIGGSAITSHARASLVWNDGYEQDGISLAFLGPCVDGEREGRDPHRAVVVGDENENQDEDEKDEDALGKVESARRAAAASDARGAFRFRRGDFAAAAAEYVETCASLLSVVPRKHARLVLPGNEKDWNLPSRGRRAAAAAANDDAAEAADAPRPRVGARVRVLGADRCARLAVVACVDSDDETCDVLFEDRPFDGEEEEEEDAVAFARLRGFSLASRSSRPDDDAAETTVSFDLADALLNVARCHSRLASPAPGGGDAAASAAASAASASLALRRSPAALFLRGKALAASRRFDAATRDLETALRLAKARAAREEREEEATTGVITTSPAALRSRKLNGNETTSPPRKKKGAGGAADVAAIGAALRATRDARRAKRSADRRLASLILGHARAEGVDLGLDPESDLATKGGPPLRRAGGEGKHGSVPVGEVARVVAERISGKRCAVS